MRLNQCDPETFSTDETSSQRSAQRFQTEIFTSSTETSSFRHTNSNISLATSGPVAEKCLSEVRVLPVSRKVNLYSEVERLFSSVLILPNIQFALILPNICTNSKSFFEG